MINSIDEAIEKAKKMKCIIYMRNLALALGLLVTVSFGAFAITPQKIFEMHCMQCHNGKRASSAKELHTKFAGNLYSLSV